MMNGSFVGGFSDPNKGGGAGTSTMGQERMLEFIRSQEADLMLNMSRLNPNTENFFQKQNQFLELQSI